MDALHELSLKRRLDAPRAAVWRCWTEPALLMRWFCPKPWQVVQAEIELRPGGRFYTLMQGPAGERVPGPGVFLDVIEGRRLVFTDAFVSAWVPSGKPFMVGDVRFSDHPDGGTDYLACARHWTDEDRRAHEAMGFHAGWGAAALQLEELARSL